MPQLGHYRHGLFTVSSLKDLFIALTLTDTHIVWEFITYIAWILHCLPCLILLNIIMTFKWPLRNRLINRIVTGPDPSSSALF